MGLAALSLEANLAIGAAGLVLGVLSVCILLGHANHTVRLHRLRVEVIEIRRRHRTRVAQDGSAGTLPGRPGGSSSIAA